MEPVTKVQSIDALVRASSPGFDDEITQTRIIDPLLLEVCGLRPRKTVKMKVVA